MPKSPRGSSAIVDQAKLVDYLLNPDHLIGRAKCRFLDSCGFQRADRVRLEGAILAHAVANECVEINQTPYGKSYAVVGPLIAPDGRGPVVRVVWFIREGEDVPRLVTLVPARME